MAITQVTPRQVAGLEQAYKDIEELKQQVRILTERLAQAETTSGAEKKHLTVAAENAMREPSRNA